MKTKLIIMALFILSFVGLSTKASAVSKNDQVIKVYYDGVTITVKDYRSYLKDSIKKIKKDDLKGGLTKKEAQKDSDNAKKYLKKFDKLSLKKKNWIVNNLGKVGSYFPERKSLEKRVNNYVQLDNNGYFYLSEDSSAELKPKDFNAINKWLNKANVALKKIYKDKHYKKVLVHQKQKYIELKGPSILK